MNETQKQFVSLQKSLATLYRRRELAIMRRDFETVEYLSASIGVLEQDLKRFERMGLIF